MRMFQINLMAAIVLLMFSPVHAQDAEPQGRKGGANYRNRGDESGRPDTPAVKSPLMSALDIDGNGTLSAEEIANAVTVLKAMDANKDGSLQPNELVVRQPEARRNGNRREQQRGNSTEDRSKAFVDRVMARDADGDGTVSKDEAGERMARFFGRMDGDGDGVLTKSEVETMAKQFTSGGRRRNRAPQPKSKDNRPPFDDE